VAGYRRINRSGKRKEKRMNTSRIVGIVALAIGVVLLIFAQQATQAPVEELSNTLTGRYTDETMWYLVAGVAAAVGGGALLIFGRR
jgi:drug/metabolite transporter (DMT)-like permease